MRRHMLVRITCGLVEGSLSLLVGVDALARQVRAEYAVDGVIPENTPLVVAYVKSSPELRELFAILGHRPRCQLQSHMVGRCPQIHRSSDHFAYHRVQWIVWQRFYPRGVTHLL